MTLPEGVVVNQPTRDGTRILFMAGDGLWKQMATGKVERLAAMDDVTTLAEKANKIALESVKNDKPHSFTVGGYLTKEGSLVGGVTYSRSWHTGWGATGYLKAYWHDLPIRPNGKPEVSAGVEISKKFE